MTRSLNVPFLAPEDYPMSFRLLALLVSLGKAGVALAGGMLAVLGALDLAFGTSAQGWYALNIRANVEALVTAAGIVGAAAAFIANR